MPCGAQYEEKLGDGERMSRSTRVGEGCSGGGGGREGATGGGRGCFLGNTPIIDVDTVIGRLLSERRGGGWGVEGQHRGVRLLELGSRRGASCVRTGMQP